MARRCMAAMGKETFLILNLPQDELGQRGFVQFANWESDDGSTGLRAEAIGSLHLPDHRRLTAAQHARMAELGWEPNEGENKDDNLFHEWGQPAPFPEMATTAVVTLREIHGVTQPAELTYKCASFGSEQVGPLDLGIEREQPARRATPKPSRPTSNRPLEPIIEEGLLKWFPIEELIRDSDGDYPVPVGSAVVYVRADDGPTSVVSVFSAVLTGIEPRPGLFLALNDLNRRIRFARVFWSNGAILMATELPAVDITADQIVRT